LPLEIPERDEVMQRQGILIGRNAPCNFSRQQEAVRTF